jgi:hypothetical protein
MARVVDRLLAQLPGLQGAPAIAPESSNRFPAVVGAANPRGTQPPTAGELILVWVRVLLGLGLGIMMATWPYSTACGVPLFWYASAIVTVSLAGAWAATAAWRVRSGLAHIVALILVLYGIALGAAEVLPRTGYAVDRATWVCE